MFHVSEDGATMVFEISNEEGNMRRLKCLASVEVVAAVWTAGLMPGPGAPCIGGNVLYGIVD